MNWYHRKVEESNLWDYSNIQDVEVLKLNGFDRFKLDGLVFVLTVTFDVEKIFYFSSKVFEQFY